MARAGEAAKPAGEALTEGQLNAVLRFAAGTTATFVVCESMGWYPTFLAPLLAATLLGSLPAALPAKAGLGLVLIQAAGAGAAYVLSALLEDTPFVLFGVVSLVVFLCFANLARGGAALPGLLVLIAFSAIPVATVAMPQQAGVLPVAFIRSMAIAVLAVWAVYTLWPERRPPAPPAPAAKRAAPLVIAGVSCAIVLPLMLYYLMYSVTDALPLLITTVVLVVNFEARRSAMQGAAMVLANFIGGIASILAFTLLQVMPNLATLCLLTFLMSIAFGVRVAGPGPAKAIGLISFNQAMVLFSLALVPGGSDGGLWLTRLVLFGAATVFAVCMMALLLPRYGRSAGEAS